MTDEEDDSATDGSSNRTIDLPAGIDPDDPPVESERSDGDCIDGWPADLRGVTESVVATLGPNGRWNQALLGLHSDLEAGDDAAVTARTWGRTRTRRNFQERGGGYVQFVRDPLAVTEAALGIYETDGPVLATADAWVEVEAVEIDRGNADSTEWIDWELSPRRTHVVRKTVPTTDRGFAALFQATVAASRLDVEGYDTAALQIGRAHV